jgi:hypothetical protein
MKPSSMLVTRSAWAIHSSPSSKVQCPILTSDRNKKENFRPVDGEEVLRKIGGLNLTSWNYIGHDPEQFRHYGPVAQEFFAAFGHDGVGTVGTPTTLNSGDVEGILMIAVQTLSKENAELKARIEALERLVEKSLK